MNSASRLSSVKSSRLDSNLIPVWVGRTIRRSSLSYAAQALLMAILDHDRYGQSKAGCIASLETLAAEIDATNQYVSRLLASLIDGGWVVVSPHVNGKARPLRMGPACKADLPTIVGGTSQQSVHDLPTIGSRPPNNRWDEESFKREREKEPAVGPAVPQAAGPPSSEEETPDPADAARLAQELAEFRAKHDQQLPYDARLRARSCNHPQVHTGPPTRANHRPTAAAVLNAKEA